MKNVKNREIKIRRQLCQRCTFLLNVDKKVIFKEVLDKEQLFYSSIFKFYTWSLYMNPMARSAFNVTWTPRYRRLLLKCFFILVKMVLHYQNLNRWFLYNALVLSSRNLHSTELQQWSSAHIIKGTLRDRSCLCFLFKGRTFQHDRRTCGQLLNIKRYTLQIVSSTHWWRHNFWINFIVWWNGKNLFP